ncbi:MAG: hypothetical protein AABW47_02950 [Nanoarchaeota archaeon]
MAETFLQIPIISNFILPFLLVFTISFAILEKTKLFGDSKKQLNAIVSAVASLIFVGAVYPKMVVGNLILYFTVAIVAIFVILLIWGFIFGDYSKEGKAPNRLKLILGIFASISFVGAVVWATGWYKDLGDFFGSNIELNQTIWTNALFIIVIAIALALILGQKAKNN